MDIDALKPRVHYADVRFGGRTGHYGAMRMGLTVVLLSE